MTSFPLRGRWLVAALMLVAVWAQPASAATLGQTAPADTPVTCIATSCTSFQQATGGSSPPYTVPAGGGTITSWSIQGPPSLVGCPLACSASLLLLRPEGAGQYRLAAASPPETIAPGALNTFPLSTPIPALAGDVLGLQGSNIPISAAGGTGDVLATVTGLPVVGDLIGGLTPTLGQLLNVSVTLDVGVPSGGGGGSTTTQPPQNMSSHFAGLKLLARTLKVGPTGRARIPVACPAAADGACRGTLSLRTVHAITAAGARMKLASARFTVPAGRTSSIPVRISRGGRRALARRHRLAARLTATARDRTNAVKSSSRTVTVLSRRR